MNYWGFHPSIFLEIEKGLDNFIRANLDNSTAEYYIPSVVTEMIVQCKMAVRVIPTKENWFGVTYLQDKPMAIEAINQHVTNGVYPRNLWDS